MRDEGEDVLAHEVVLAGEVEILHKRTPDVVQREGRPRRRLLFEIERDEISDVHRPSLWDDIAR